MNTIEFIEKSKSVHGDRYDYSKVEYINANDKVCIICPKHGEFWQFPYNHMRGHGCRKCESESRVVKDFVERSNKVHNFYYSYDKTNYTGISDKVIVTCPKHGDFSVTAYRHLNGFGCPICNGHNSNREEFIKHAKQVHSDKYDYSKVEYTNANTKVCIICHEHGEFWQTPNHHLNGCGCPKCSGKYHKNTEGFIKEAQKIHDNKYDYSKTEYIKADSKVCIICPEHGEFWQKPTKHLKGQGCPKCGGKLQLTNREFIDLLKSIYGNRYDYSEVNYVNAKTKVGLICPEHGIQYRLPNDWLKGGGCTKCKCSITENMVEQLLIENNINYITQYMPKWLKSSHKHQQSLDFYLPDYNIAIECQGCQHFRPIKAFGGDETFKVTVERDKNKKLLCEKHNVNVIYFSTEHTIPESFLNEYHIIRDINELKRKLNETSNSKENC